MKKIICILLMLVLAFSLTACIEREDEVAAQVQKKIEDLGTISLDSERNIERAERAYEALTLDQRENVSNYGALLSARATFETLAQDFVTEELEKAEEAFAETHDVKQFFLDTNQILSNAKQAYKQPVLDARERVKALCYPGTHFINLRSFLEMTDAVSFDAEAQTITVNAGTEVYTDDLSYTEYSVKTHEELFGKLVDYVNLYAYGDYWFFGPEGMNVWAQVTQAYSEEVLSQYSQSLGPVTVDWGDPEEVGTSHVVFTDDTGAQLYWYQFPTGGSYYKYYDIVIAIKK